MAKTKPRPGLGPFLPRNCPLRMFTGDGRVVGRCLYYCGTGPKYTCPTHGDVTAEIEHFQKTGRLTDEPDPRLRNAQRPR